MTKNTGKEYEALTEQIFRFLTKEDRYTSVEKDVYLDSADGPRQFDVVLKSQVAGIALLTVIECRDFSKNLCVTHVDGLHSKATDVNASKAVLVARKGFSKTATKKAKRLGIDLCTVRDINRNIADIGLQIPIVFTIVQGIECNASTLMNLEAGTVLKTSPEILIDNVRFEEYFFKQFAENSMVVDILNEQLIWQLKDYDYENAYMLDGSDKKTEILGLEVTYVLTGQYYFGYVHELPNTVGMENLSNDVTNVFFNDDDVLFDYKSNLCEFTRKVDIPDVGSISLAIVSKPKFTFHSSNSMLRKVEKVG
jgi:hypothetical protein